MGVKVKIRPGRPDEELRRALRRLSRAWLTEGYARDLARHRYHMTRNERRRFRRRKSAKARTAGCEFAEG